MDANEFRKHGHAAIEAIAEYMENVNDLPVVPKVAPNFLQEQIPADPPKHPESFDQIIKDFNDIIMPGITHWQSGKFMAYYPTGFSFPSLIGEMYASMLAGNGFLWICNPAATELETITVDWLAKLLGLDERFLSNSQGGGVIQTTASDSTFVSMVAARHRIATYYQDHKGLNLHDIAPKLVAYASDQSHSSIEKAAKVLGLQVKVLPTDSDYVLRGETVAETLEADRHAGLLPFFICATIGTTSAASVDDVPGIVKACQSDENIWIHVDAAYAGSAMVCPEFRHHMQGCADVDSFTFNPHKWLLVHFDCSCLFVKNSLALTNALTVKPYYLRTKAQDQGLVRDYSDYQLQLGRRFRSLKLWFTLRNYGQSGLQKHIHDSVGIAQLFIRRLSNDPRLELVAKAHFALVCFRLKPAVCYPCTSNSQRNGGQAASNDSRATNENGAALQATNAKMLDLLHLIQQSDIFLTKAILHGKVCIRVSFGSFKCSPEIVEHVWSVIRGCVDQVVPLDESIVV
ncbi:hypothetical protein H4R34_001347 [Dimargaris verticillata]|uniref:Aromatic-L-amino-acid decarboxylase n=1 Tax=Dimargaris verticillata TaxID=2761393 RepID=A0A9W8BBL3_9FUNG|nr:hypothetical protein H4R34_001347 [Dimargaris verticillata]